jgi:hypothetical protein
MTEVEVKDTATYRVIRKAVRLIAYLLDNDPRLFRKLRM